MPTPELSIEALKNALDRYDWAAVRSALDAAGGRKASPQNVAEALRRARSLVIEYPSAAAEKKRNAVLQELEQYLASGAPDGVMPCAVVDALATLRVAEAGYRKMVGELTQTPASKLEPTMHAAAAIRRAEIGFADMNEEFNKHRATSREIAVHAHFLDEDGNHLDMDSVLENFVLFVSMTVQMEAHRNKWHGPEGHIVVPSLPRATEEAIDAAGSTLVLAVLWRRWKATEERARTLGRTFRVVEAAASPRKPPDDATQIVIEEGDDSSDWAHRVALERVTDKMAQNALEIATSDILKPQNPKTMVGVLPLPPLRWVSNDEIHGISGLEQYLAYDVTSDPERPGGLRLVEWVRGYCALKLLERSTSLGELVRTRTGWQDYLARFGLASATSELLISHLTFCRTSRDLFDHPFIRLGTGEYRLIPLALRSSSVPIVVLSTLGHLGVQLQRKGRAFEEVVRDTFESAGIKSYSFKAKRGDEEYEFDAVVPWGDYLFVIECKNRSLPFGNPTLMRYFDLETQENLAQVHRLMKGLDEYPDILAANLPADAAQKSVVPILLNCFPYSAPGKVEGVYLYDYSALARFFESGEIKLRSAARGKKVEEYSVGIRLWTGDRPTPEDLLAQLEQPTQFKMMTDSLAREGLGFPLPPDWWVYGVGFIRKPVAGLEAYLPKNH